MSEEEINAMPSFVSRTPTMRWVTKNVEVDRKEYLNAQGIPQSFGIVEKRRVLQQCVQASREPGYEWVDVPEVTDEP